MLVVRAVICVSLVDEALSFIAASFSRHKSVRAKPAAWPLYCGEARLHRNGCSLFFEAAPPLGGTAAISLSKLTEKHSIFPQIDGRSPQSYVHRSGISVAAIKLLTTYAIYGTLTGILNRSLTTRNSE